MDPSELATAFADFARNVFAADGTPTIWCFWQEPDHTIGANLTRDQAFKRYVELFKKVGPALRKVDRDFVIAGVQQNASAGLSAGGVIDGADYKVWTDRLVAVEAKDGARYPLDYVTIQNYKGTRTLEIVQNSRVAYASDRFNTAPVLFNEWNLDKDASFSASYDTPSRLASFVDQLRILYDQPDVAYALLMRNIFAQKPLAFPIVHFLDGMTPFRRVITMTEAAQGLHGLASADDDHAALLLWNAGTADRTVAVELKNLSQRLVASSASLTIETMSDGPPELTRQLPVAKSDMTADAVVVPAGGVVMIHAGGCARKGGVVRARYARDRRWVGRRGDASAPAGMGHYDVREGGLLAGVAASDGVGLASVVLADVPAGGYSVSAELSTSGLPTSDSSIVLALRLDYLEGDQTAKTIVVRDPAIGAAAPWPSLSGWPSPGPIESKAATLAHGSKVTLDVSANAPVTWSTADGGARRIAISLLLAGSAGTATVRARLSDAP